VAEKLCAGSIGADQQKILRYWTKYESFCASYSLPIFSLGCIKAPWGDGLKFGTLVPHLL